jgi:hypothetical protein
MKHLLQWLFWPWSWNHEPRWWLRPESWELERETPGID